MAARIRKIRHDDETRLKIQTSQLLIRLQNHVLGEVEMTSTQLRAAEVLLKKTLPDLTSVEMSGDDGGPMKMVIEWATQSESESDTSPDDNS
jgi:hypothetical protein